MSGIHLGKVMNRHLGREISVYLTTSGPGFIRPTGAISQTARDNALAKIRTAFEGDSLFNADHMKTMTQLNVSNMTHSSEDDPNAHYSVQGVDSNGSEVNDGHVQEDKSKQTRAN